MGVRNKIAADVDRVELGAAVAAALEELSTQKTEVTPTKTRALRNYGGRGECPKVKNNWVDRADAENKFHLPLVGRSRAPGVLRTSN